jgi:DNA-binding MarR family transcriptional regulator
MSLNRPDPPTMGAVASLLAMDRTTLTAALKPLERRGLLAVAQDPTDRRVRRLVLTDTGRPLLAKAARIWQSTHDAVDRLLADKGGDGLRESLRAVSSALSSA